MRIRDAAKRRRVRPGRKRDAMPEPMKLDLAEDAWQTSSRTNSGAVCVELNRSDPEGTAFADTKVGRHMRIEVGRTAAGTFLAGAADGIFGGLPAAT